GCLIIDDTSKTKSGRKVQWLSWFYDHSKSQYFTGFQNILCAYTNGRTAIPIDFEFKIGKSKVKHYTKSNYKEGTHAEQRVRFAKQKKIDIAIQMIKRAFQRNFQFQYILWDSWYNSSTALEYISEVVAKKGVNLISMLKNGNTKYKYKNGFFDLKELYHKAGKWETNRKTGIKSKSIIVEYMDASQTNKLSEREELITIKIAFYKYPHVKKWKAILSTDLELEPTEILHFYLRRWSIECIFRELKQYFGYNQSKSSNYIVMIADFTIRCGFFIMFCHIREIENHKPMCQLLLEFYEELFDEWLDNYIKLQMQKEIENVLLYAKGLGMQSLDELILNLDNVMKRFFDEVFLPDKISEADKQAKRRIA
ncbi:MAG: transposase, partial [Candidatus Tenebribacter davisii]|nr:transposase [Candidatus Tenebribacter davisii]